MEDSYVFDTSNDTSQSRFNYPHIFCSNCFSIPEISIAKDNQTLKISCPICKEKSSLGSQEFIFQIDSMGNDIITDKNHCQILPKHKSNPSINYCIKCRKHLCSKCEEYHTIFFEKHPSHMFLNPKFLSKCSSHPTNTINKYCEKCKKHLCNVCNLLEHQGHTLLDIKDENKQKEMDLYIKQKDMIQDDYVYLRQIIDLFKEAIGDKFKKSLALNKLAFKNSIYSVIMSSFIHDLKIVPSIHYVYNNIKNNHHYEFSDSKSFWILIHDSNSQFADLEPYLNKFGISVKSNDKDRKAFLNSLRTFDKIDIAVCGSSKSGKTTFINSLDGIDKETEPTTKNMNRRVKFTNNLSYLTISLWDTLETDVNNKELNLIMKDCDAILYILDVSNLESKDYIDKLHKKVEGEFHEKIEGCILSKISSNQVINKEEAIKFLNERGIRYIEIPEKKKIKKEIEKLLNDKIFKDIKQKRKEPLQKTLK